MPFIKVYNLKNIKITDEDETALDLPKYVHMGDAGMDLRASTDVIIQPGKTELVPTGLCVQLPSDEYELQVRPRSGLSLKTGLRVANAPGTIDSNYRGEIKVIMGNISKDKPEYIKVGDRVAQLVLAKVERIEWLEVDSQDELTDTNRGVGGFGSTGV